MAKTRTLLDQMVKNLRADGIDVRFNKNGNRIVVKGPGGAPVAIPYTDSDRYALNKASRALKSAGIEPAHYL